MDERYRKIFNEMQAYFPFLAEDAVDGYSNGPNEIVVILSNGDKVRYNAVTKVYSMTHDREVNYRKEFADRLELCMQSRGMNQSRISDVSGISRVTISKYLNGRCLPTYEHISRLARALHCSPDDLVYYD